MVHLVSPHLAVEPLQLRSGPLAGLLNPPEHAPKVVLIEHPFLLGKNFEDLKLPFLVLFGWVDSDVEVRLFDAVAAVNLAAGSFHMTSIWTLREHGNTVVLLEVVGELKVILLEEVLPWDLGLNDPVEVDVLGLDIQVLEEAFIENESELVDRHIGVHLEVETIDGPCFK